NFAPPYMVNHVHHFAGCCKAPLMPLLAPEPAVELLFLRTAAAGQGAVDRPAVAGGAFHDERWAGHARQTSSKSASYSLATNSSTVRPAARIKFLSVPRSSSLWSGTESVTVAPSRVIMMWLPRCRAICQPNRSNTRTASRPPMTGRGDIRAPPPPAVSQW